ncbi:CHASE3 domain-containing protein [Nocardioides sp. BP30]|uniref:sensor histidine kinase n=1 Tax=Nocardioides sp. BP30 TaxID=3036374 RepID=UPI0024695CCD|nr:CHASE3 domain-containing protein [Nocardioides sp. BP30]WGL51852.1 CHASE3 domain-containing protein [Nocardioides sp. BP30]
MSAPAERRRGRMTVQRWIYLTLGVMTVLVALGAVIGAQLLAQTTRDSDRLIKHIQPARVAASQLQATLIDQETGERGYALTADPQFLAPYEDGQKSERALVAQIRALLPHDEQVLADLDRVESAAAQWRHDFADPLIAGVTPGHPRQPDETAAIRAKASFDQLRGLFTAQNEHLLQVRDASLAELRHARQVRDGVFVTMLVLFFLTAALMIVLVRGLVIRPLEALRASSRRIAGGDFEHPISQGGPGDLRALARDVDRMRHRITEDLDTARRQEREMSELAASLDAQALELRRSNAELEQFAYVASHDLQEPLRKVASFCQLLEKRYGGVLDERGQQYIDFAVDGAKRMQVLITDLLTFSRVGRISEEQASVPLDAVVDRALANLATAVEETGALVSRPVPLPEVSGDPTLLAMLWQNLVANAIKFRAADRPPVVTLTCRPDPDRADGAGWLFAVTDNGIGIPAEFADKVFVLFQRLHSREAYAGTGIGLALCRKIVEYHGGRIWIDTEHTGGTRICFTLPTESAERDRATAKPTEGIAS